MNEFSLYRCLGDPTRLTILKHLAAGDDQTVTQLVERTGQERTNVSHHLSKLRECGLVRTRPDGKHTRYSLGHAGLKDLLALSGGLVEHIVAENPDACIAQGCC